MPINQILSIAPYVVFVFVRQYYHLKAMNNHGKNQAQNTTYESKTSRLLRNTALNLLYIVVVLQAATRILPEWLQHPVTIELRILGLLVAILGIILLVWTHEHLGRQWSADLVIQDSHRLVVSGPYHWVRHPMYTALFAFFIGAAIGSGNFLTELLSLIIILDIHFRIPAEEQMMLDQFGEEYRSYSKKTGRLFPGIR